jgi:hypothetical protein
MTRLTAAVTPRLKLQAARRPLRTPRALRARGRLPEEGRPARAAFPRAAAPAGRAREGTLQ